MTFKNSKLDPRNPSDNLLVSLKSIYNLYFIQREDDPTGLCVVAEVEGGFVHWSSGHMSLISTGTGYKYLENFLKWAVQLPNISKSNFHFIIDNSIFEQDNFENYIFDISIARSQKQSKYETQFTNLVNKIFSEYLDRDIDDFLKDLDLNDNNNVSYLYNCLNHRVSSFHHLGLTSFDTSASLMFHFKHHQLSNTLIPKLNNDWNLLQSNKTPENTIEFFKKYYFDLKNHENELLKYNCIKKTRSEAFDFSVKRICDHISNENTLIENKAYNKIQSGINDLIMLKGTMNLSNSYESEIGNSFKFTRLKYYLLLIIQLLLVSIILNYSIKFANTHDLKDADFIRVIALRFLIALPVIIILGLLHSEYKIARVEYIKFKHLKSLINGGATAIPQMVTDNEEAKKDALAKIAFAFLDNDRMLNIVQKNSEKEKQLDIKTISEVLELINKKKG